MVGNRELGLNNHSDASFGEYVVGTPLPTLRSLIRSYRGCYEDLEQPLCRLRVPSACVSLILGFGDDLRIRPAESGSEFKTYQSFVVGLEADPLITEHYGTRYCIEIALLPWAADHLFQGVSTEFAQEPVALGDIWGKDANRLVGQLSELSSWSKRFSLIDRVLLDKFAASDCRIRPEIRWAWNQLESQGGCLSIRKLAKTIGWSDRHFAKCFREQIGITPKAAARQIRFTQAHQLLTASNNYALSEIALHCGYSDQSHLTREVHSFSGYSPKVLQDDSFASLSEFPGNPEVPGNIVQSGTSIDSIFVLDSE